MSLRKAALAALLALLAPTFAQARPFTVDDYLRQESFGAAVLDPGGRWLVVERRDPYATGRRFDYDFETGTAVSRLWIVDLKRPGPARPLLGGASAPGEMVAGFSPGGTRLAIYRLQDARWTLGVVTLATRKVAWFPITPEAPDFGRSLQWLTDTELLVVQRPSGQPWVQQKGHVAADELPARWRATAVGAGSSTALGSGVYRQIRARPVPDRLLRLDVATGRRKVLAAGQALDLDLSPDGRRVALLSAGADLQPRAGQPVHGDWGIATQRQDLSVLDLTTGREIHPCPGCDALPHVLSWSPDGAELLVYTRRPGAPWTAGSFRRIEAATGRLTTVGEGLRAVLDLRPEVAYAGWMGHDPIVYARPAAEPEARPDWYRLAAAGPVNLTAGFPAAPNLLAALDARGLVGVVEHRLWRADPAGAAQALEPTGVEPVVVASTITTSRRPDVTPPRRSWILADGPGGRRPRWVGADGSLGAAGPAVGEGRVLAVSGPLRAAVTDAADPRRVATLRLVRADRPPLTLARLNAGFAAIDAPQAHAIAHTGPDGRPITSWLFLPHVPAGAPPPPLVVRVYSGRVYPTPPQDIPPPVGSMTNIGLMVGHGYAVLVPSLPIPEAHEPMAGLADRILAIVDQAAADPALQGAFDPDRLAIWGHSYGGYTVMAAIGQTRRFRAAVALAGASDLTARWGATSNPYRMETPAGAVFPWSNGWTETLQGGMGGPPWAEPERYVRNSPLFSADRIVTPLMIVSGDQDIGQPTQSELMFSALYRQDKDAILVTYWGEGHIVMSPGNVRDLWRRAFAFLDEHLRTPRLAGVAEPRRYPEPAPASGAPTPPRSPR